MLEVRAVAPRIIIVIVIVRVNPNVGARWCREMILLIKQNENFPINVCRKVLRFLSVCLTSFYTKKLITAEWNLSLIHI